MTWMGHGRRLAAAGGAGIAAGRLAGLFAPAEIASAIGWDAAAAAYVAHVWLALAPASAEDIAGWSAREDEGRWAITLILAGAAAASLVAIFDMVSGRPTGAKVALAAFTIFCSWALLHTVFAAHYAHRCFAHGIKRPGLDFPGEPPRFVDFGYYAFTIGMTFQTSDVATKNGEMRALTLLHGVLSFIFNTVIIAISVGLASGVIGDG